MTHIWTIASIWPENILGYLSADIICPEKRTVSFEEQAMPKDKYLSIFSPQMEATVFIVLQIFFETRPVLKKGEFSRKFLSFGRGLFGHVKYLDQSLASENIWWIIKRNTPWGTTIKLSSVRCPYTHDIAVVKFSSLHFLPWSSI